MGMKQTGPDTWRIDVSIWREGKEYRQRETFTGGKKAAENQVYEIKKTLRLEADRNGSLTITANTFAELLAFYRERVSVGHSSVTLFNRLLTDLGDVRISDFADRFDRWLLAMQRSKGIRTGRPITNGTINRYLSWCKVILNYGVKHQRINRNPIAHIDQLKEIARDVCLSQEDERRLLNVIDVEAPHIGPAVRFMLQVPCRKAEVVNMRRADVDLFNNCIRVRNGTAKNDAGIDKPIPPDLVDYMRAIPAESGWVFYRKENRQYHSLGDFKKSWLKVTQKADLKGLRVHDTRHSAATRLIDNGTPEQVVMTVAGWKTNMLRTYYHRNPKKALEMVRFQPETRHLTRHAKEVSL